MRTVLDPTLEAQLRRLAQVRADVMDAAEKIAEGARDRAPKRTGAGAASIHAELVENSDGTPEARVSWDKEHFYMAFAEFGTAHQPARPFLRPAAHNNE